VTAATSNAPRAALGRLLLVLLLLALAFAVFPCLPGRLQAEYEGEQSQIRDGRFGQERGAERCGDGGGEDGGEAEVLAERDPAGGTTVPRAPGEEQRQDQDVVDVGDSEEPGRLRDDAQVHRWTPSCSVARRQ
jgi:hypothetical protein